MLSADLISGSTTPHIAPDSPIDLSVTASASAGPFERLSPLGGFISASRDNVGQISGVGDVQDFTFFAEANQRVSAVIRPDDPGVSLQVSLVNVVGPVASSGPGEAVVLPLTSIASDGAHTLRITGDDSTSLTADIYLNAALETEVGDTDATNVLSIDLSELHFATPGLGSKRFGVIAQSEPQTIVADAIVWGAQPDSGQILKIEPITGRVLDRFDAPDALVAGHTRIGLSIAEDGASLLYINSDLDPNAFYRLDPDSGAVLSVESVVVSGGSGGAGSGGIDGIGFDYGPPVPVTIFNQDFESGIGSNEVVFGAFVINDTNFELTNGTRMMGHPTAYGNNEYSYYEVTLDLTGISNVQMQFDYVAWTEAHFDRINVQASTGQISPPDDLITPISGLPYEDKINVQRPELGSIAYDSNKALDNGTAVLDLSSYDDQNVTVRIQFGSDGSITFPGINVDNIVVTGVTDRSSLIFLGNNTDLQRQDGFSGPQMSAWATGQPTGALGGDSAGRQFGFFSDGFIHEYDPLSDTNSFIRTLPAPAQDVEGMAYDGTNLYVSTASGDLFTLDPDTGTVFFSVPVSDGGLFGLGALGAVTTPVPPPSPPPPPPPPPPTPTDLVYVTSRDFDETGGQIEMYDEAGNFVGIIDDPIFDTGVISDVELGPTGNIYVAVDVDANGITGGLAEFASNGTFLDFITVPNDTGQRSLLYPTGFEVLSDGSFLIPKPNSARLQHVSSSGTLIGERFILGSAPVDVAVTDSAIVLADNNASNQQFVNTASDEFGWMAFANANYSELFDPNLNYTGNIRAGHDPVDPQEASDRSLFVTNSGDDTLRKFDANGQLERLISTIGKPIGLAVASGEVMRSVPFPLGVPSTALISPEPPAGELDSAGSSSSLWSTLNDRARVVATTGAEPNSAPLTGIA